MPAPPERASRTPADAPCCVSLGALTGNHPYDDAVPAAQPQFLKAPAHDGYATVQTLSVPRRGRPSCSYPFHRKPQVSGCPDAVPAEVAPAAARSPAGTRAKGLIVNAACPGRDPGSERSGGVRIAGQVHDSVAVRELGRQLRASGAAGDLPRSAGPMRVPAGAGAPGDRHRLVRTPEARGTPMRGFLCFARARQCHRWRMRWRSQRARPNRLAWGLTVGTKHANPPFSFPFL